MFRQKVWRVFDVITNGDSIKNINFTELDLEIIEVAIEDITYTPAAEDGVDEEDYAKTLFQIYIDVYEIKEALSFLKPLPGGTRDDYDFI